MDQLVNIFGADENILIILKELKKGKKRFVDLTKAGINRTTLSRKLSILGSAKLVEFGKDFDTGEKGYYLTPYGKAVLEKLEELEALLQAIAETPTEEEKKELVKKALSGRLKYDKEVVAGRDREV